MKTIPLESWESFEQHVSDMIAEWSKLKAQGKYNQWTTPRFRGHADVRWKLETTLERFTKRTSYSQEQYFEIIRNVQPTVLAETGKHWNLPDAFIGGQLPPSGYELMIYLRQYGFLSPLLDWTRSHYVAAFFAFEPHEELHGEKIAIYSYIERFWCPEIATDLNELTVHGLGPNAVTDTRHFAQQCEYSICEQVVDGRYVYGSHEIDKFGNPSSNLGPVKKYVLPASERAKG